MSIDISGFGLGIHLIASNTYPVGVPLSAFADDADPMDIPGIELSQTAMGLNGDLVVWSSANPIAVTLNMIPNGLEDIALSFLAERNRVGRGKSSARDKITLVAVYPDSRIVTFTQGVITNAPPAISVSSSGRYKSKAYQFAFENKVGA